MTAADALKCLLGAVFFIALMLMIIYAATDDIEAQSLGNPAYFELMKTGG